MRALFRTHPVLVSAIGVFALLTVLFAARLIYGVIYWSAHENEPIQPWMTVGYVGRSWDLSPRELDAEAGLPLPEGHPLTLAEIAKTRGVPVSEVIADLQDAIATLKARQGDGGQQP